MMNPKGLVLVLLRTTTPVTSRGYFLDVTKTQSIPYELWKRRKPKLKYFIVWECLAKVEVPLPKKVKIGHKMVDCVIIGYVMNNKAYRFLLLKSDNLEIRVNTIIE